VRDVSEPIRRLDTAVDAEIIPLIERKDDGEIAEDQLATIGCRLLEMGVEVLAEVPNLDLDQLEATVLAVMTAAHARLREPPAPAAEPRVTTRRWQFGGGVLTVAVERIDDPPTDDEGQYPMHRRDARLALRELGRRVRQRRHDLGLSRRQLARRCGLLGPQVWLLEHGLAAPHVEALVCLAAALDTDPGHLVRGLRLKRRVHSRKGTNSQVTGPWPPPAAARR
jgi:hypothetical protein